MKGFEHIDFRTRKGRFLKRWLLGLLPALHTVKRPK
jgi:hypothetical protein